jgi:hypothetical protein
MILIDILFFDESIEAYLSRSAFLSFMKSDPSFLSDESQKHATTLVVPSPIEALDDVMDEITNPSDPLVAATQFISTDKMGRELFRYHNFPKLNPKLYRSRPKSSSLLNEPTPQQSSPLRSASRLRRTHSYSPRKQTTFPEACIYSTYLILFSRILSSEYTVPVIKHNPPSLTQILSSLHISRPLSSESGLTSHPDLIQQAIYNNSSTTTTSATLTPATSGLDDHEKEKIDNVESLFGDIELVCLRAISLTSSSHGEVEEKLSSECERTLSEEYLLSSQRGFVNYHDNVTEEAVMIARAAMEVSTGGSDWSHISSLTQILFELFEYMESRHLHIDEEVYRSPLVLSCGLM